jgi:hypothetical protein
LLYQGFSDPLSVTLAEFDAAIEMLVLELPKTIVLYEEKTRPAIA